MASPGFWLPLLLLAAFAAAHAGPAGSATSATTGATGSATGATAGLRRSGELSKAAQNCSCPDFPDPKFQVPSSGPIVSIASSGQTFAAKTAANSSVAWGKTSQLPSNTTTSQLNGTLDSVFCAKHACAATMVDGGVVAWGSSGHGGLISSDVAARLTNVSTIYPRWYGFAAVTTDGSVVEWGQMSTKQCDKCSCLYADVQPDLVDVVDIVTTGMAFAALKRDGSVVSWGRQGKAGSCPHIEYTDGTHVDVSARLTSNVTSIYASRYSFAALKTDGSVVTWGFAECGGAPVVATCPESNGITSFRYDGMDCTYEAVPALNTVKVVSIASTITAFAAVTREGCVVTWGWDREGGDSSLVSNRLVGVESIHSCSQAFAAKTTNGDVVTWGALRTLGYGTTNGYAESFTRELVDVQTIYTTTYGFAALRRNGSVVTWGEFFLGPDMCGAAVANSINVSTIASTNHAFAAITTDGGITTWGRPMSGGNMTSVRDEVQENVTAVYSSESAFAAVKQDGTVVSWGSGHLCSGCVAPKCGLSGTFELTTFGPEWTTIASWICDGPLTPPVVLTSPPSTVENKCSSPPSKNIWIPILLGLAAAVLIAVLVKVVSEDEPPALWEQIKTVLAQVTGLEPRQVSWWEQLTGDRRSGSSVVQIHTASPTEAYTVIQALTTTSSATLTQMVVQQLQATNYTGPMPTMVTTVIQSVTNAGSSSDSGSDNTMILIAVVVAAVCLLLALLVIGALVYLWKRNTQPAQPSGEPATPHQITMGSVGVAMNPMHAEHTKMQQ